MSRRNGQTIFGVSDARLLCADSNHRWADTPFYVEPNERFAGVGKKLWRRRQPCERTGCGRVRVMVAAPRTKEIISVSYSGPLEKLGRVRRGELRAELIRRRGVSEVKE